ncbi:MAG TPA: SDR family NAD(P)-dependent oxidoreductase [Deltaproteobacteria bacterium]|nr:SDR family NAD(P)-dependent oxidoreductase [Deltaproteobacteria bacterium]
MSAPRERHVVITGASSGIGAALARAFAGTGAGLTLVARRRERLLALADEVDARCHVVVADLAEPARAADWLPEARGALGPIDVLVNNAGVQIIGRTHEVDVELGERSLSLNLATPLRLMHAVLPEMLERGGGTLVNIASVAALAPTPGMTWYNAGKAGLSAASEALRGELRGTGVEVLTVYPGIISDTAMGEHGLQRYRGGLAVRSQPRGSAARLAEVVVAAVEASRPRVIWPHLNVLARHFPATTRWLMDRLTPPPEA